VVAVEPVVKEHQQEEVEEVVIEQLLVFLYPMLL
tara:strand:- start:493 stop:594 length:102 start_codon:yes stop_codon:yes gene_type:complete